MPTLLKILALAGSARRASLNRKFLSNAADAARRAGADVTLIDLNDFELPLYNGDLEDEKGLPEHAAQLIQLIETHDALLIASPEYNSMVTPLLKNTLDWCTRGEGNPFDGKTAGVISASPGALGGIRSLQLCQQLLLKLGCVVQPGQCMLPHADKAFDSTGLLVEDRSRQSVEGFIHKLIGAAQKLRA